MAIIKGINECSAKAINKVIEDGLKAKKTEGEIKQDLKDTFGISDEKTFDRLFALTPFVKHPMYASDVLRYDREIVLEAVKRDPEIVAAAIKEWGQAIKKLPQQEIIEGAWELRDMFSSNKIEK